MVWQQKPVLELFPLFPRPWETEPQRMAHEHASGTQRRLGPAHIASVIGSFSYHMSQLEYWQHTQDGKLRLEDAQMVGEQPCSSI